MLAIVTCGFLIRNDFLSNSFLSQLLQAQSRAGVIASVSGLRLAARANTENGQIAMILLALLAGGRDGRFPQGVGTARCRAGAIRGGVAIFFNIADSIKKSITGNVLLTDMSVIHIMCESNLKYLMDFLYL